MDKIRAKQFPQVMRGYDRAEVDAWRDDIAALVQRLEEQAPRDAAVKRALEEVGQETSAILQRAHEAADDIAARSRSQAEGRLQRAEREAELTVSEAEARVRQLDDDYRRIWDERQRLIEEMRQLADDVLGVADDASERVAGPVDDDDGQEVDESTQENPVVQDAGSEAGEAAGDGAGAPDAHGSPPEADGGAPDGPATPAAQTQAFRQAGL